MHIVSIARLAAEHRNQARAVLRVTLSTNQIGFYELDSGFVHYIRVIYTMFVCIGVGFSCVPLNSFPMNQNTQSASEVYHISAHWCIHSLTDNSRMHTPLMCHAEPAKRATTLRKGEVIINSDTRS